MSDMKRENEIDETKTNVKEEQVAQLDEATDEKDTILEETKEEKEKLGTKIKESFHNRKFTSGAYTTALSAIVIIIVLVLNLFVSRFDLKVDLSSNAMFSLSKQSKECLNELKDDITIYFLAPAGQTNSYFDNLLKKYDAYSDHIKVEYKDPDLYPKFARTYTDETVTPNGVIIVNETNGRSKYLSYHDLVQEQMSQQTMQMQLVGIDFEGRVTAAILNVTNENLPIFYQVTGHGETQAGTSFSDLLDKQNIKLQEVATAKVESIPEDCSALIITAPRTDYDESEVDKIMKYLQNGGKALIFADMSTRDCTNFMKILNDYGVDIVEGIICEGDHDQMADNQALDIIPKTNLEASILEGYTDTDHFIVTPVAVGLKKLDTVRSTTKIDSLLYTSNQAYAKANPQMSTLSKEEGDQEGPFDIGMMVTDSYNGVTTQLLVIGDSYFVQDNVLGSPSLGNYSWLSYVMGGFSGNEVQTISIPARSLEPSMLTLTSKQQNYGLYISFIGIPVCILAFGAIVAIQRRKR